MKIHSDILILELLKLIIYVADTNSVSIANLKQGFNTLIKIRLHSTTPFIFV